MAFSRNMVVYWKAVRLADKIAQRWGMSWEPASAEEHRPVFGSLAKIDDRGPASLIRVKLTAIFRRGHNSAETVRQFEDRVTLFYSTMQAEYLRTNGTAGQFKGPLYCVQNEKRDIFTIQSVNESSGDDIVTMSNSDGELPGDVGVQVGDWFVLIKVNDGTGHWDVAKASIVSGGDVHLSLSGSPSFGAGDYAARVWWVVEDAIPDGPYTVPSGGFVNAHSDLEFTFKAGNMPKCNGV